MHINTGGTNSSGRYALEVRNASQTHMYVRDDGLTGFRTRAPAATVHIKAHSTNASTGGLRIEYASNGNNWQMGVSSDSWLRFTRNGVSNAGVAFTGGGVTIHSDKRIKKDIQSMDNVLDKVMELRPVTYLPKGMENPRTTIGVIAQEVEQVFPEAVYYDKDIDRYSVKYDDFGVISLKAIQEMNGKFTEQDKTMENELQKLRKDVEGLKRSDGSLSATEESPPPGIGQQSFDQSFLEQMQQTLLQQQDMIQQQQAMIDEMRNEMDDLRNLLANSQAVQDESIDALINRIYLSEQAIIELGSCCDDKQNDAGSLETGANETLLFQNHPNPFNRETTITYKLVKAGHTELVIYDDSSLPIETVVDEDQDAGTYNIKWDGSNYTSGVYIYMLKQNDVVLAKKMVLIK